MLQEGTYQMKLVCINKGTGKDLLEIPLTAAQQQAVHDALHDLIARRRLGATKVPRHKAGKKWDLKVYAAHMEGFTPDAIADDAHCSKATVEGAIRRVENGRYADE